MCALQVHGGSELRKYWNMKYQRAQQLTITLTMITNQHELEGFMLHLTIKRAAAVPLSNQV